MGFRGIGKINVDVRLYLLICYYGILVEDKHSRGSSLCLIGVESGIELLISIAVHALGLGTPFIQM